MKDLFYTFTHKICPGPVQGRPCGCRCTYQKEQIELLQVSIIEFQRFFLFWVAGIIVEARDIELERTYSFMFQFCV